MRRLWLLLVLPLLPLLMACPRGTSGSTLNISILLPDAKHGVPQMSLQMVQPVVDVAVATAKSAGLLAGLSVRMLSNNSECDYAVAPVFGMMLLREVDLMLGPYCSFSLGAVARYNRYHMYRRTIVTSGGGASVLDNKREYYNLVRVGPNHRQIEEMLLKIFQTYGWVRRDVQNVLVVQPQEEMNARAQQSESIGSETLVMATGIERMLVRDNSYIVRRLDYKTGVTNLENQLRDVLRDEVRSKGYRREKKLKGEERKEMEQLTK